MRTIIALQSIDSFTLLFKITKKGKINEKYGPNKK